LLDENGDARHTPQTPLVPLALGCGVPLPVAPLEDEKVDLEEARDIADTASFMVLKVLSALLASCMSLANSETSPKIAVPFKSG
jgi:hypothetical protein